MLNLYQSTSVESKAIIIYIYFNLNVCVLPHYPDKKNFNLMYILELELNLV